MEYDLYYQWATKVVAFFLSPVYVVTPVTNWKEYGIIEIDQNYEDMGSYIEILNWSIIKKNFIQDYGMSQLKTPGGH